MIFRHLRNVRGFLSDYYLGSVFAQGRRRSASDRNTDLAYARFRRIWERAEGKAADSASFRERFVRPLLGEVFGFHLGAGQEKLFPLHASAAKEAAGHSPLLMVLCPGWAEELDQGRGAAHPATLLGQALSSSGLKHGLLLTGERLRLLRTPGEGPRGAYLEADLEGLAEDDDGTSFSTLYRLLSASAFQPDFNGSILIEEVERESRLHAEKVSEDLKAAVFSAAEALASGLIEDALRSGKIASIPALTRPDLERYRDASLAALYRILFILYAEARDPRLDGHRLYREAYSVHGLLEELLREPLRDWPANRSSLWSRLKALFVIYDQGLPPVTPWENIPPRGGDFFSTATAAGRMLQEARLPDRTVARLLLDLATTVPRRGVGRERVSFRELDIESLGAVYEGILEFEPRLARQVTLELRVQGRLLSLPAEELVQLCEAKGIALTGDAALVAGTPAEALHAEAPASAGDEEGPPEEQAEEEDTEDEAGEEEDPGVRRGATARLLRRLEPGSFHFVPGPGRKGSGSFYTPRLLTRDVVQHALAPLVQGRSSAELERLRILDPACGSAHFLVESMRYLGQALHKALVDECRGSPPAGFRGTAGQGWDDDWQASDEQARAANSEARAWCKRRIAERCLFGVDLNPTAVTLARVALWIESVAGDRPLSYFEHHIRCGNSLLGSWMERLELPPLPSLDTQSDGHPGLFQDAVRSTLREAAGMRRSIDQADPDALAREGVEAESVAEQRLKEHLHRQAEDTLAAARLLFDLRSASAFVPEIWAEWEMLCGLSASAARLEALIRSRPWAESFQAVRERERFFHWELEFPEIFLDGERAGFDTVLGNPPWDKVLPSRKEFYSRHDMLVRALSGQDMDARLRELAAADPGLERQFEAERARTRRVAELLRHGGDFAHAQARSGAAHEDLSKYFLDRASRLVRPGGLVGLVLPSVVYNGDGCVGLRRFLLREASIERFYGFENRRKIFPIDSRYKFISLVFRREPPERDGFEAAFMRHDLGELENTARAGTARTGAAARTDAPWIVGLSRAEVERLSPETCAFLEYRGPEDQRIVGRMHEGRPTLGSEGPEAWGARLFTDMAHMQIYNATRDKDLWTDAAGGRLFAPDWILSRVPKDMDELVERMAERGFWPVYEGKHIEQFLVGVKPFRWWLCVEQAERKYGRPPRSEPTLVFRETASNTNERTCIAAVLPARSAGSHTLTGVIAETVAPDAAATILNSMLFDWALRLRTAGTHVSFTYIQPMPVPPPALLRGLPAIPTRLAWRTGLRHITEDATVWPDLCVANRRVAEAYGLGPGEFGHILSAFPVFARKRAAFFQYLLEQLRAWAEEAGG